MIYKLIAGAFILLSVATASAIGGAAFVINGIGTNFPEERMTVPMSAFHTDDLQQALNQAAILAESLDVPVDIQLPPATYPIDTPIEMRDRTGLIGAQTPRDLALWMTYFRLAGLAQCQTGWRTTGEQHEDIVINDAPACPWGISKIVYGIIASFVPLQLPRTTIDVQNDGSGIDATNVSHVLVQSIAIQGHAKPAE